MTSDITITNLIIHPKYEATGEYRAPKEDEPFYVAENSVNVRRGSSSQIDQNKNPGEFTSNDYRHRPQIILRLKKQYRQSTLLEQASQIFATLRDDVKSGKVVIKKVNNDDFGISITTEPAESAKPDVSAHPEYYLSPHAAAREAKSHIPDSRDPTTPPVCEDEVKRFDALFERFKGKQGTLDKPLFSVWNYDESRYVSVVRMLDRSVIWIDTRRIQTSVIKDRVSELSEFDWNRVMPTVDHTVPHIPDGRDPTAP